MILAERDNAAGFTLMEALIAVVILAGIAAVLVPAVRTAVRVEARASSLVADLEAGAGTEDLLRELLLRAHRPPRSASTGQLAGTPTSLSFLTLATAAGTPQLARLEYESGRLELTLPRLETSPRAPQGIVLAEQLDQVRFLYFGDIDDGQGAVWHENWDQIAPPQLVALDLLARDGGRKRIEARVGGAGPFDCGFDSGQGICLGDTE
ncbi:type II secretion system protein [Maricaulis sp.]|uniref:type II secretion system protein n=1 Tax=Maricaulis sp. TaxID=1486257 RepID=UPI003A932D7B